MSKAYPEEKVGVFAKSDDGKLMVIEYSELPPSQASATDPSTGLLYFNWANICMHYFSVSWLLRAVVELQEQGKYHVARK